MMVIKDDKKSKEDLFNGKSNILLTGNAGTGKTSLLKQYIEKHPDSIVCAPTGTAA